MKIFPARMPNAASRRPCALCGQPDVVHSAEGNPVDAHVRARRHQDALKENPGLRRALLRGKHYTTEVELLTELAERAKVRFLEDCPRAKAGEEMFVPRSALRFDYRKTGS